MSQPRGPPQIKGVYERVSGSDVWWIRYADAEGHLRREKAGSKAVAIKLYSRRKGEVIMGRKLPETLRSRKVTFRDLVDDMLEYSKAHKVPHKDDSIRANKLLEVFGTRAADSISPQDLERWFSGQTWKPATANRYKALVSLIYKLGNQNGKVTANPAKLVKTRREYNARDRYLTEQEEAVLRAYLAEHHPERLPELDIAIHTGMRRGEQYGCEWSWVDLEKRVITVPRSKHGEKRYVYLNDVAVSAFRELWKFSKGTGKVFAHLYRADDTKGAREWFANALTAAGITGLRWHDLRHTYASRLVMSGLDIRTVQELMGHKTITLRYAHLAPTHHLAAVQRLCDTGTATNGATYTKTSTERFEHPELATARRQ